MTNKIIEAGTDVVYASIDGATKETYEKLRVGSNFNKVIENIKYLFEEKKNRKSKIPKIKFSYTINKYNVNEIEQFVGLVSSLTNGDETEIEFKRLNVHSEEIQYLQTTVPQETIDNANEIAKKLDIKITWINIPKISLPTQNCARWPMPFVSIKGDVFPCCFPSDPTKTFGNLLQCNFKSIWDSKEYTKLRKNLKKGEIPEFCQKCPIYFKNNEK
jgi:radical SAM protein with 4Fe4S-binding SPASM domain